MYKNKKITVNSFKLEPKEDIAKVVKELKKRSKKKGNYWYFLSGQGGSWKSYVISVAQRYCHKFCQYASILYDNTSIYLTKMTGCAAALTKGLTRHSAINFESKKSEYLMVSNMNRWM